MTKEELFKKYSVNPKDKSTNVWEPAVDNWISVELYRIMHDGNLPNVDDVSVKWITDFMDKTKDMEYMIELMNRPQGDWGSLFLTGKRMIFRFADKIIQEI